MYTYDEKTYSVEQLDALVIQLECIELDIANFSEKKQNLLKIIENARINGYKTYSERYAEQTKIDEELAKAKEENRENSQHDAN